MLYLRHPVGDKLFPVDGFSTAYDLPEALALLHNFSRYCSSKIIVLDRNKRILAKCEGRKVYCWDSQRRLWREANCAER